MELEKRTIGDFMLELVELEKVDVQPENEGPYSITYGFGGVYTLICC